MGMAKFYYIGGPGVVDIYHFSGDTFEIGVRHLGVDIGLLAYMGFKHVPGKKTWKNIPSRELTYPTLGKGKSYSKCHFWGIC